LNRFSIEFLKRPECHLCDEAAPRVRRAARLAGMRMIEVDIDLDDDLVRDYGLRIPVVRLAGDTVAEGHISSLRLWWKLIVARIRR
jgi:hypothetical protein